MAKRDIGKDTSRPAVCTLYSGEPAGMTGFRGRADEKRLESDYAERYYARQSSSRRKANSEAGRCGGCLGDN